MTLPLLHDLDNHNDKHNNEHEHKQTECREDKVKEPRCATLLAGVVPLAIALAVVRDAVVARAKLTAVQTRRAVRAIIQRLARTAH